MNIPAIRQHVNMTLDQSLILQSKAYIGETFDYDLTITALKQARQNLTNLENELEAVKPNRFNSR